MKMVDRRGDKRDATVPTVEWPPFFTGGGEEGADAERVIRWSFKIRSGRVLVV